MSKININDIFNIEVISHKTNFWLIRTKKGFFYSEYVEGEYIALGWNILDYDKFKILDDDEKIKSFKDELNEKYATKQGSTIFNKCYRFINEMKEGDIVMMPSFHNDFLTFGIIGSYYEAKECTYEKEIEVDKRIKDGIDYGTKIECQYKKRRKIKVIKTIEGKRLNPNLYKVLASYHGLSKINKYSNFILSSIYNFYVWDNKLHFVVNIEKEEKIDAKYFSELIYYVSDILTIENDVKVYTQANVNSPGDIISTVGNYGSDWAQYLQSHWYYIFIVWGAISGVKIGPITLNSIPETIIKISEHIRAKKGIELENKLKEIELETKKIDLNEKKLGLLNEAKEKINEATNHLQVNTEASSNIIKVNFYKKDDES